ncbi:Hypothetical predicted protein [Octopus vulgaris]|uniref:Uncharacterized protein n=1 Tax=Octopus vulgaris TaxID=6645 RepID=A0AA36AK17_OCTVU|nr:Hypothetical predicted protein [Octopus vulgaris]
MDLFFTPVTDVFASESITSIKSMVIKNQTRWSTHIDRMADERTPKQLFYGELAEGKCNQCKHRKRFKDSIRTNMKSLRVDPKAIETLTSDRAGWRTKVWGGMEAFEEVRMTHERLKRNLKKTVEINEKELMRMTHASFTEENIPKSSILNEKRLGKVFNTVSN